MVVGGGGGQTLRDLSAAYPEWLGVRGQVPRASLMAFPSECLRGSRSTLASSLGWLLARLWLSLGMTECSRGPTGLPRENPESYHSFMWNNFFKHIDIHPENTHILDGNAADLQAECDAFEEKIKAAGGIELFVGGELDAEQVSTADQGLLERVGRTRPKPFSRRPPSSALGAVGSLSAPEEAGRAGWL